VEANKKTYIFPFEKLDVWQMAVNLAQKVLDYLEELQQRTKSLLTFV
jgi:hypothetical protein